MQFYYIGPRIKKGRRKMMYSEFIENANVKDDMLSWAVYSGLTKLYMKHDEITKEEVYRYGRLICDDVHEVSRPDIKARRCAFYHGGSGEDALCISYRCGHCSWPLTGDEAFCPQCGAEFIKETTGSAGENKEKEKRNDAEQKERRRKESGERDQH